MTQSGKTRLARRGRLGLRAFYRDRRGVSAVEFALIAPLIIIFYFGMVEFCQGFMAQKRMGHTASMVADLVAQSQAPVTKANLDDILGVDVHIMSPFSTEKMQLSVTSLTQNDDGEVVVDWTHGDNPAAPTVGSVVDIPDDLIVNGESLVMSQATYGYDSPISNFLPGTTTFTQTHYLRPRSVNKVECSDCPVVE